MGLLERMGGASWEKGWGFLREWVGITEGMGGAPGLQWESER